MKTTALPPAAVEHIRNEMQWFAGWKQRMNALEREREERRESYYSTLMQLVPALIDHEYEIDFTTMTYRIVRSDQLPPPTPPAWVAELLDKEPTK